ncbi:MAG TPA: hypothetical protein VGI12_06600 [Vicinamibacterales bacterium]
MPSFSRRGRVCVGALAYILAVASPAAAGPLRVAFWNIMSGKGVDALPGFAAPFRNTPNCTDPTQPLNAWGEGASQAAIAQVGADPSVIAFGLAEAWSSVCGSGEHVRQALGWKAVSSEQNGVTLVARYGFGGPEQWRQLDTSRNPSPSDTMWVVRAPVCVDAACSHTLLLYVTHWYGPGDNAEASYAAQAQGTLAFLNATANGQPHVLVGDLNVFEGSTPVCDQTPVNTALPVLRAAGYVDAWTVIHGSLPGYTGMVDRSGCGFPNGFPFKRIDYAWTPAGFLPLDMQQFAITPVTGDASPSDHFGIVVTVPDPAASAPVTPPPPGDPAPTPPPTVGADDVVLYARSAKTVGTAWSAIADTTAAGGIRLFNPDAGASKLLSAAPMPASYVEIPFLVQPGRAYRLWMRGMAQQDSWQNDSAFVQFSGSLDATGRPVDRIGSASAAVVSIEEGSGMGLSGWGWQDSGYGGWGDPIAFEGAAQTLRIQVREDGLSFDQILLSPARFMWAAPGLAKNDTTVFPEAGLGALTGPVVWTSLVKATASLDVLRKTGPCATCFDAGGISAQRIMSDGAFSLTVAPGQRLVAGLAPAATAGVAVASISYGLSFWPTGVFEVRENGMYRTEGPSAPGDVFTVTVHAGVVQYFRNGGLLYTSETPATGALVADTSLSSLGVGVTSAAIK